MLSQTDSPSRLVIGATAFLFDRNAENVGGDALREFSMTETIAARALTLDSGPGSATARLILAHGAGSGMSATILEVVSELLAERGVAVTRFEFQYMAQRRQGGSRRPPPPVEKLAAEFVVCLEEVRAGSARHQRIFIGGKSLGGRVASLIADRAFRDRHIEGLICLGYPFHPVGKPAQLRIAHLTELTCPTLIVQGVRDPFGSRGEVEAMPLSDRIRFHWAADGDHDLGPRGNSGFTRKQNLTAAADAVKSFMASLSDA